MNRTLNYRQSKSNVLGDVKKDGLKHTFRDCFQQYSSFVSKEKRLFLTNRKSITALHINQRFLFAESSFARIFSTASHYRDATILL